MGKEDTIDVLNSLENDREHLSASQQSMISTQLSLIKADYETVKSMHEMATH